MAAEGFTGVPVFQVTTLSNHHCQPSNNCIYGFRLVVVYITEPAKTAQILSIPLTMPWRMTPWLAPMQAEGLTVKTGKARYTPLFLSKADLDIALANADGQRCAPSLT